MTAQKTTPAAVETGQQGQIIDYKGRKISLGYHQNRLYNFLSAGSHQSVADISTALKLSDPRGGIRDLRDKGIEILDEWIPAEHGGRFKRYFLPKAQ